MTPGRRDDDERRKTAPLDEMRSDLREAIERYQDPVEARRRPARKSRVLLAAAVALLVLSVGSAGASALITGSTGLGALDDLLALKNEHNRRNPAATARPPVGAAERPHEGAPSAAVGRGIAGAPSKPLRVPWGSTRHLMAFAYLAESGETCFVLSAPLDERPDHVAQNTVACQSTAGLDGALVRRGVIIGHGRTLVVGGFTRPDVRALSVRGPEGAMSVRLSRVWAAIPGVSRRRRLFVAFKFFDGPSRRDSRDAVLNPRLYRVKARLSSGRVMWSGL